MEKRPCCWLSWEASRDAFDEGTLCSEDGSGRVWDWGRGLDRYFIGRLGGFSQKARPAGLDALISWRFEGGGFVVGIGAYLG